MLIKLSFEMCERIVDFDFLGVEYMAFDPFYMGDEEIALRAFTCMIG